MVSKKKVTRKNKLNRYKNNKKKRTKRSKIRAAVGDAAVDLGLWLAELIIILKLGFLGLGIGLAIVSSCYILYSMADVAWVGGKQIKKS